MSLAFFKESDLLADFWGHNTVSLRQRLPVDFSVFMDAN